MNNKMDLSILSELYIKLSKLIADTVNEGMAKYKEKNSNATSAELLVNIGDPIILSILNIAVGYLVQIGFSKQEIVKQVELGFDDYMTMGVGAKFSPLKEAVTPNPTQNEIKLPDIDKPKSSGWNVN